MGRFGQSRYKDPAGTPAALRGIREVTDKNKHILLEAVFNGDFIPDHLLPVGIHRCGQIKWRAHLCTVGHKFSGPPRDNVRDACEDRRRFCEENGVNFVLYGKQTHAKGPLGSRPSVSSTFPRLSDYMTALTGKGGASAGKEGGSAGGSLTVLLQNPQMRPFLDAIESSKKLIDARIREEEGDASYVVTPSIANLHKRIVEDAKDGCNHIRTSLTNSSHKSRTPRFTLCPLTVTLSEGVVIKFVWDIRSDITDGVMYAYLESVLVNASPPINQFRLKQMINEDLISGQIRPQIEAFDALNNRIDELVKQTNSLPAAMALAKKSHHISTRKSHSGPVPDYSSPFFEVVVDSDIAVKWNCMTPDSTASEFAIDCENQYEPATAGDVLFSLLDGSLKHRMGVFGQRAPVGPTTVSKSPFSQAKQAIRPEDGLHASDEEIAALEDRMEEFRNSVISSMTCLV
jgi:hypothetical protein